MQLCQKLESTKFLEAFNKTHLCVVLVTYPCTALHCIMFLQIVDNINKQVKEKTPGNVYSFPENIGNTGK